MLQFPFYGGIGYVLTKVANVQGHTLSDAIAHWFVSLAHDSSVFSILVSIYSAFLGFFIPSAGGKWVIEAPYIMDAANQIQAHLGWTVMVYNIAETLPNFINPFWMLPLLGILRLKSKDLVGYTAMQFLVHFPHRRSRRRDPDAHLQLCPARHPGTVRPPAIAPAHPWTMQVENRPPSTAARHAPHQRFC